MLREFREDAWEVYFAITYRTESTGALNPWEVAAARSGTGVRVKLCVLYVKALMRRGRDRCSRDSPCLARRGATDHRRLRMAAYLSRNAQRWHRRGGLLQVYL